MSDERLILPVKHRRHRHRFFAIVAGCLVLVFGVWGIQMKVTFKKMALAREGQATQAANQSEAQEKFQAAAATLKDQISTWQNDLQRAKDTEAVKQELLAKVAQNMKANLEAQSAPAPVVAGENTEVPAP